MRSRTSASSGERTHAKTRATARRKTRRGFKARSKFWWQATPRSGAPAATRRWARTRAAPAPRLSVRRFAACGSDDTTEPMNRCGPRTPGLGGVTDVTVAVGQKVTPDARTARSPLDANPATLATANTDRKLTRMTGKTRILQRPRFLSGRTSSCSKHVSEVHSSAATAGPPWSRETLRRSPGKNRAGSRPNLRKDPTCASMVGHSVNVTHSHPSHSPNNLPAGWEAKFDIKSSKYFYVNHQRKVMRSRQHTTHSRDISHAKLTRKHAHWMMHTLEQDRLSLSAPSRVSV
jgi:hypothetical protein